MDYSLQTFPSVSQNNVQSEIKASEWFSMIKGCEWTETIKKARTGALNYESTKISLPCINFPFLFKGYKKNKNIVAPTGLLYFDIDDPRFDPSILDMEKVYMMYKSFGGVNYVVVVQVEGMSSDTYRYYYQKCAEELGIVKYVDTNAAKQVQTNVISHDSEGYYNPDSTVLSFCTQWVSNIKKEKKEEHIERGWVQNRKKGFCFSNMELIDFKGKTHHVDWFNITHIRCHIPTRRKKLGSRNNMLLAFGTNFMVLNPYAKKEMLIKMLETVDNKACSPSVGKERIQKIANSIIKYKQQGELRPIYAKNRSMVFNDSLKLTLKEKQKIVGDETRKYWENKSCQKIKDIIDNWDFKEFGKITIRKMEKNHNISKNTLVKYNHHFKDTVKKLNKSFADSK